MRRRRMHRLFTDEPLEESELERLVYAAGRAPVARDGIRHLVVVTDGRLLATLRELCPGFVNNAPAAIAICSDLERVEAELGPRGLDLVAHLDAGAAAAYLTLAAPALGLGVCVVTSWTEAAVQEVLGLPERIVPQVLVAAGRPVAQAPRAMRRFEPAVHREQFGR
jgi:nitroreductase